MYFSLPCVWLLNVSSSWRWHHYSAFRRENHRWNYSRCSLTISISSFLTPWALSAFFFLMKQKNENFRKLGNFVLYSQSGITVWCNLKRTGFVDRYHIDWMTSVIYLFIQVLSTKDIYRKTAEVMSYIKCTLFLFHYLCWRYDLIKNGYTICKIS